MDKAENISTEVLKDIIKYILICIFTYLYFYIFIFNKYDLTI